MKNKILILLMAFAIFLTSGCGCSKEKDNEPGETENNGGTITDGPTPENPAPITNQDMIKDQTVESLQFTQTALTYDGNMTVLTSKVKNISDTPVELSNVVATINYKDEYDNDRVLEMDVYFGEKLEAGEERSTENFVDVDLRKSTNIEYKIVR